MGRRNRRLIAAKLSLNGLAEVLQQMKTISDLPRLRRALTRGPTNQTLPYQSDAASAVPDTVILACQDHGAAAAPGWFSCWLPTMALEVIPPAPPHRLDR